MPLVDFWPWRQTAAPSGGGHQDGRPVPPRAQLHLGTGALYARRVRREGKQQRSASSRRYAASALRELGWLAGYPDQGAWRSRLGAAVSVDGALIAHSRRLAQTLLREHAEALGELVGEVGAWWGVVDAMLRWHSAHPHGARDATAAPELVALAGPRAVRAAQELSRAQPALAATAHAAAVAWALEPEQLAPALRWLGGRPSVAEHGVARALALAGLALLSKGAAAGVAALLGALALDAPAPRDAEAQLDHVVAQLRRSASAKGDRAPRQAPKPGMRSRPKLEAWLERLLTLEAPAQRFGLEVLAVLELEGALGPWQEWERKVAPKLERALAMAERGLRAAESRQSWALLEAQLLVARETRPPAYALEGLDALLGAATGAAAHHLPAIARWIEAFPRDGVLRAAVLSNALAHLAEASWPRLLALWDGLAAARKAGARAEVLGPWCSYLTKHHTWWQEPCSLELVRPAEIPRLRDALLGLAAHGEVSSKDYLCAALWVAATTRATTTSDLVQLCLASRDRTLDVEEVELARAALTLAEDQPDAQPLQAPLLLEALTSIEPRDRRCALALVAYARSANATWLVREALRAGHGEALALCASALAALPKARWPRPPADAAADWIAGYPPVLAAALGRLAEVDPGAEDTAAAKLGDDLPAPAALRREIAALKARRPLSARQATRLANLQRRLARPEVPSPQRLARLAGKLEGSAVAIGVSRLVATLTERATERLVETFELGCWPGWELDRKRLRLLLAMAQLPAEERALAGRLLRARAKAPPWDLRDAPENAAYLAQLGRRGVRVEPWLDDSPRTVTVGDQPLELALTSDPLEVFAMGAHFETCLSPGSCNFFSVVANAADVNKRVLYARRQGKVIGRCLLAITDGGALLTFHPYCHERLDFGALVRDFVQDLATRMATQPVAQGPVRTLVARRWYDDGAHDLTGRFAALRELDELDWSAMEPAAFLARLRERLQHELDDLTLPMVLRLRVLTERPALLVALAPFVLASAVPSVRLAAATLAFAAQDLALADRLLGELSPMPVDDHSFPTLEVVAQLRPQWMLARLRATVDAWTRKHGERGARAALQGVALEALHRPRQAVAAYRKALQYDGYLLDFLEPRMRALGASDP